MCDQSQQLLVNKSDTFEGCDIDTLRDKTFLNNINESKLLKLSPPNKNDFEQHIKHAAKPSSSLRTMDGLYKMLIPVQSTCRNPPSPPHMIHKLHPRKKGCSKNCYCEKGKSLLCMMWLSVIPKQMQFCTTQHIIFIIK